MMDFGKNFFAVVSLALVLTCFNSSLATAQADVGVKEKSHAEFAKEKSLKIGDKDLAELYEKGADGKVGVLCGDAVCGKGQKCITCEFKRSSFARRAALGAAAIVTAFFSPKAAKDMLTDGETRNFCIKSTESASSHNFAYTYILWEEWQTCKDATKSATNTYENFWGAEKEQKPCSLGSDGKNYCLSQVNDELVIEYGDEKKSMTGCEVLPVKLYKMQSCFFCPLFAVVYNAAGKMPVISVGKLAQSFAILIAIGLAIWIAIQVLAHVSSLTKQDAPKFLGGLIKQSYKFLIAFALLYNASNAFNYIILPILDTGIRFGNSFNDYPMSLNEKLEKEQKSRVAQISNRQFYNEDLYKTLDTYVTNLQKQIAFMQAVGSSLICTGGHAMVKNTKDGGETFADGFQMVIQGIVFAVFGFLLAISYAFYMIDAIVQMGIVGGLVPFLIASWPFKLTSKYTKTGMDMLLNSAFIFVFIGLCLSICLGLIDAAIGNNVTASEETTTTSNALTVGGVKGIAIAINEQDSESLKQLTDISGVGFLILLFCCVFGFKLMKEVTTLAGKFASGAIKPIAPGIATMGASAALSAGKKLTQPMRKAASDKIKDVGGKAVKGAVYPIAHPFKSARAVGRAVKGVYNKATGKGSGGGSSGGSGGGKT